MATIVKELNELAEKMTGTNPKATTDAQAWDYIEQNYNGGSVPSNVITTDNIGTYAITTENANTNGIVTKNNLVYDEIIPLMFINQVLVKGTSYLIDDETTIENLNVIMGTYNWYVKDGVSLGYPFFHKPIIFTFLSSYDDGNNIKVYKTLYSGEIEGQRVVFGDVAYGVFNKLVFDASDYYVEFTFEVDEQENEVWRVKKYDKE